MGQMKARCAICEDVYGSKWICPSCRRDPANRDWREAPKGEVNGHFYTHLDKPLALETDAPVVSDLEITVLRLYMLGYSEREIGSSIGRTRAVAHHILAGAQKKVDLNMVKAWLVSLREEDA